MGKKTSNILIGIAGCIVAGLVLWGILRLSCRDDSARTVRGQPTKKKDFTQYKDPEVRQIMKKKYRREKLLGEEPSEEDVKRFLLARTQQHGLHEIKYIDWDPCVPVTPLGGDWPWYWRRRVCFTAQRGNASTRRMYDYVLLFQRGEVKQWGPSDRFYKGKQWIWTGEK